jgi:signal transduction histidine kinase
MLAHEIRTPLGAITNALHVLDQIGIQDDRALRQVALAIRQSRHLARLVEDVLDLSRVARGKLELRRDIVDLAAAGESAAQTLRPLVEAAQHQLTVSLPPQPVCVEADPVRLEQVISNLLTNAVRYTEPGGQIWLSVEQDGAAVVRVRDTGIGIRPKLLPHIFDLFTQGPSATARSRDGLGIGLSLVRHLVEIHGGTVQAASAGPGQGSEFTVRLPLAE